jgi:hypothetical protein
MACEGCRRRREALKRMASNVINSVTRAVSPSPEPAQSRGTACAGCTTKATSAGWVNVCRICLGQSDPTPSPNHSNEPKCNLSVCERRK